MAISNSLQEVVDILTQVNRLENDVGFSKPKAHFDLVLLFSLFSLEAYSTPNDFAVMDLRKMQEVDIDSGAKTAKVGAGAR